jgi:hypothetical protein
LKKAQKNLDVPFKRKRLGDRVYQSLQGKNLKIMATKPLMHRPYQHVLSDSLPNTRRSLDINLAALSRLTNTRSKERHAGTSPSGELRGDPSARYHVGNNFLDRLKLAMRKSNA